MDKATSNETQHPEFTVLFVLAIIWALPVHRLEARDVCKGSIASSALSHAVSMPYWGRGYKL